MPDIYSCIGKERKNDETAKVNKNRDIHSEEDKGGRGSGSHPYKLETDWTLRYSMARFVRMCNSTVRHESA
jgi:hypothetical protein